ncbi:MAG TPA: DegQ family serine endoprotease [Aestuariivirgaceae bacterium]
MKRIRATGSAVAGYVFWLFALLAMLPSTSEAFAAGPESVANAAERLLPAVVNISTTQKIEGGVGQVPIPNLPENSPFKEFFDDFFEKQQREGEQPQRKVSSLGSGFVVDPAGVIVTNNHVIEGAEEIEVKFPDGTSLKAKLLGKDGKTDLAVLKVDSSKPLPFVSFGDSDALRVGDWVMAIGNPFGLGGSLTLGIVSARNRDINAGPYDDFIQTDAAINRGNSGGPLFNMDGEVIGINTAIISPSGGSIGIGFSVPANTAKLVIGQLRDFGETRRGWLGVKIQTITPEIAESLNLGSPDGALVSDVVPTGPAEKAGIKAGDVILSFDGKAIREMRDLPRLVADTPVEKSVDVVVMRSGAKQTVKVVLGRLEEGEKLTEVAASSPESGTSQPESVEVLGMKIATLNDELRKKFSIEPQVQGVVVLSVAEDSSAYEKRIEPGDVITEADQRPALSAKDISQRVKEVEERGKDSILLLVSKSAQQGEPRFIGLKLKKG